MLDEEGKADALRRLRKIEGQVAGVRRMVEGDAHCVDVLTQVRAVQGALQKVGQRILAAHMRTCVRDAMESDDPESRREKIDELVRLFARYGTRS